MSEPWEFGEEAPDASPRFPWPPGEEDSVVARFGETWRSATFDPTDFFQRVPKTSGTGAAVLYYLVIALLVAGATLFWDSMALYSGSRGALATEFGIEPVSPIVNFLLTPAILLGSLFVAAAVYHMVLSLFDGVRHGFGTTIRVVAYAYSPGLFGVVPWIGSLVGSVWMVVLLVIGLREAHETDGWRAAAAVLIPLFLLMTLMILSFMMIAAAGAALLNA